MRNLLFVFNLLLIVSAAKAQGNGADSAAVVKFTRYYNAGKADSIYALFGDEVKTVMSITVLDSGILQLKSAFGNISETDYFKGDDHADTYIGTFERSGPVLYINFNKHNRVIGFFVNADRTVRKMYKGLQCGSLYLIL